jgi:hypothetical protein
VKAAHHAVESFLPQLAGRNVLVHEDNHAVCHILACLTSRAHVMMDELLRYHELDARFGKHSIDRFASALNTLLPRYNARWRDPTCEAVDALHLLDSNWRKEKKWCNPRGPYYSTSSKKYGRAVHRLLRSPDVGQARFGTKRLPRWPPMNYSSRPDQSCSKSGVGHYAVQHALLTWPTLYSESPPSFT